MSSGQGVTEYIELADFSKGITATPGMAANGEAQRFGTLGCYAPPGGGLAPLPKLVESISMTFAPPAGTTTLAAFPWDRAQIVAGGVMNGVGSPVNLLGAQQYTTPDMIVFMLHQFAQEISTPTRVCNTTSGSTFVPASLVALGIDVGRTISGAGIPAGAFIVSVNPFVSYTLNVAATANATGVTLTLGARSNVHSTIRAYNVRMASSFRTPVALAGSTFTPPTSTLYATAINRRWAAAAIKVQQSYPADGPTPASLIAPLPHLSFMASDHLEVVQSSSADYNFFGFPDIDNTVGSTSSYQFNGNLCRIYNVSPIGLPGAAARNPYRVVMHQGRLVTFYRPAIELNSSEKTNTGMPFASQGVLTTGDLMVFDKPGYRPGSFSGNIVWTTLDQNSGVGVAASYGQSLLLVRNVGGAQILQGPLEQPTVVQAPGAPSVYGAGNEPAITSLGVFFGTKSGVFVWAGGDQFQCVSAQLEGWFWKLDDGSMDNMCYGGNHGKWAYRYPFVYGPNNWVFDVRNGAWWKLMSSSAQDNSPVSSQCHAYFDIGTTGQIYAWRSYIDASQTTVCNRFDPDIPAAYWQWKSQPLAKVRNRRVEYREVTVVVEGEGIIQVTLTGLNGATAGITFTGINTAQPQAFTLPIDLTAHDVVVQISSTGTNATTPTAPTLHRLSLGYREAQTVS